MTDSSHADISDSICQWLTKELTGLARVSTNVALARQFDSVDLVQMTWQSVLRNHRVCCEAGNATAFELF